jgi:signal transduction histidine kinase
MLLIGPKMGVALLVLCQLAIIPVFLRLGFNWWEAALQAALFVGFAGFAYVTGLVARQQAQARDEQRRLNSELRATRALLAESVRVNERTRISRELHDLLGHTLSVITLKAELAGQLVERDPARAKAEIREVEEVSRATLAQVREAFKRAAAKLSVQTNFVSRSLS